MTHIDFIKAVTAAGGVASALLGIWSLTSKGRAVWKGWWQRRKQRAHLPTLIASIKEQLDTVLQRQEFFASELKTNGGNSLKDEVRLLVSERMMELQEAPFPAFRCKTDGGNIFANRAYETLVDAKDTQLLGLGWRAFLQNPEVGDAYFARWQEVATTGSHFAGVIAYKDSHGEYRGKWYVRIIPLTSPADRADTIWGGRLYPEDDKAKEIAIEYGWAQ